MKNEDTCEMCNVHTHACSNQSHRNCFSFEIESRQKAPQI